MTEVKYHFNKDTGRTGKCTAKIKCRLGLSEAEHFENREDAKKAYENVMGSQTVLTLNKNKPKKNGSSSAESKNDAANDINEEYLKPITIKTKVNIEAFYQQLDSLSGHDIYASKMYEITDEEKTFTTSFVNGEIPDNMPISLAHNSVAMMIHGVSQESGYFAKVTKKFAKGLKEKMVEDLGNKEPVVLDPMAGKGYFVKAMREQGVKTIGSDNKSWAKVQTDEGIEDLDIFDSLDKHGDQITHLTMSWTPMSDLDKKVYDKVQKDFPHITIINIGEGNGGCTGSEKFWDQLDEDENNNKVSVEYENCGYQTIYGLNDFVTFVKFK